MAELGQLMTPIGRLVQGHPLIMSERIDDKTKQPKLNADGTKQMQLFFALAFRKDDPAFAAMYQVMQQVAQRDWPKGEYGYRDFAWKIIDGDALDGKNQPYASRPGFAGCYVVRITSGYAIQCVADDGVRPITNPDEIKRGYYGRAYVTIRGNGPVNQSPGLYINPSFFQLCAAGEVISSGPDIAAAIASAGPVGALPPGALPLSHGPVAGGVPPPVAGVAGGLPGLPPPVAGVAGGLPGLPPPVAATPPPPPAAFPPAGWLAHPSAPGFYYSGNTVKSEAELRAMSVTPNPAILGGR